MNIIEIEHLSKKYWINHEHRSCDSLKEILSNSLKNFFKKFYYHSNLQKQNLQNKEEFWALKDINLEVKEGDQIALLGRNGAGKSTLLKILSRITEPTTGRIKVRGRVSSLLEIGAGFHPDLTGRENILLNGAIMGMTYKEIKKKFDEIVTFADIEPFLDTPLKRYSSGMFMRLGFAIAAHLDSEIMIIDEVLAVGDSQFQEKCLEKMNEIRAQNRTILFVSHNINSLLALCNKGILLDKGEVKIIGPIKQCVNQYINSCPVSGLKWKGNVGDDYIRITQAAIHPSSDNNFFYQNEKTSLEIEFEILKPHTGLILGFRILNSRKQTIAQSQLCDYFDYQRIVTVYGQHRVSFHLDLSLFHPGEYQIKLEHSLFDKLISHQEEILLKFAVYSQNKSIIYDLGIEKEGVSLGNRWDLH